LQLFVLELQRVFLTLSYKLLLELGFEYCCYRDLGSRLATLLIGVNTVNLLLNLYSSITQTLILLKIYSLELEILFINLIQVVISYSYPNI